MIYHHKITSDTQTKHRWELMGYWKSLYFMLSLNLFSESIYLNARSRAVCSNERHIPSLLLPYQRAAAVNDRVKWPFLHVECQVIFSWVMIDRWKNSFKEKKVGVIHQKMCIWPIKHLQNGILSVPIGPCANRPYCGHEGGFSVVSSPNLTLSASAEALSTVRAMSTTTTITTMTTTTTTWTRIWTWWWARK